MPERFSKKVTKMLLHWKATSTPSSASTVVYPRRQAMSTESDTGRITREEFYALTGLLVLAQEHNAALATILRAAEKITGEPQGSLGMGHTADAIVEGYSVSDLLTKLGIEVDG
jgi:hypothetical protein